MEKKLSIIIRAHGALIYPLMTYPTSFFNIDTLSVVSLARPGSVCYGDDALNNFVTSIKKYYKSKYMMTIDDKIESVFGEMAHSNPAIRKIIQLLFGNNEFAPEIVNTNRVLEKIYNHDKDGIFILFHEGVTSNELATIQSHIDVLNNKLSAQQLVYRSEILACISNSGISRMTKMYLIDLTCNGYNADLPQEEITNTNLQLLRDNIRGGKNKRNKKSKNKSKRKGKSRKSKNKSRKRR